MGWNQRGNSYNSPSGHGFLIGKLSRKPICYKIMSKLCGFCTAWSKKKETNDDDPPDHDCLKNHTGSSSSMEPQACLDMVVQLYDRTNITTDMIFADDDASTQSTVCWSNFNYLKNNHTQELPQVPISKGNYKGKLQDRPDKGRLPGHIPEPRFVADPNHRKKVLTGELLKLANAKKAINFTMTKMDSNRVGKNFG